MISLIFTTLILALTNGFFAANQCIVRINELQLGASSANTVVRTEFVELETNCPHPLDLSDYSLVLWVGLNGNGFLKAFAHFSTNCTSMTSQFLVIGNPEMELDVPATKKAQFCPFDAFSSWKKEQENHFFIDRGNKKTNALALYKGVKPEKLTLTQEISHENSHRDHLQDVVFYKKSGSMTALKDFLLPEFNVSSRQTGMFFQKDNDKPKRHGKRAIFIRILL